MEIKEDWYKIKTNLFEEFLSVYPDKNKPEYYLIWEQLIEYVEKRYCEGHRFYHSISHIEHCLNMANDITYSSRDKILTTKEEFLLKMALLFHDVVYDIGSDTNEVNSAKEAKMQLMWFGIPNEDVELVSDLILSTEYSKTWIDHQEFTDRGLIFKLMRDIDLSSFAGDPKEMMLNGRNCILEAIYDKKYEVSEVVENRIKFLKSLTPESFVLFTSHLFSKYEFMAKYNIELEIIFLRQYGFDAYLKIKELLK